MSARQRRESDDATGRRHLNPTIRQVAAAAGVSTATVSRVLSGQDAVSPALAEKVRATVASLGYRPNAAAQGLSLGSLRNVGVVMPDMANPYFFEVVDQIAKGADGSGYRLLIASSYGDPEIEEATIHELSRQVDGIVALSSRMTAGALKSLGRMGTPLVLVNRVEPGAELPTVAVDNFSAELQLCAHLYTLGHRRIVYLGGSPLAWQGRERWRGVEAAQSLGMQVHRIDGEATITSGSERALVALEYSPTALVCFNDLIACGVMSRLRTEGIAVPTDVSVVGFDDIPLAQHLEPPLTTVRSPVQQLGRQAWELLFARIGGASVMDPPQLTAELVVRESTTVPRVLAAQAEAEPESMPAVGGDRGA